jgi:hypothetical protein
MICTGDIEGCSWWHWDHDLNLAEQLFIYISLECMRVLLSDKLDKEVEDVNRDNIEAA